MLTYSGLIIGNRYYFEVAKPASHKHLNTIRRGEYASKVKCSTLKPAQNSFGEYASGGLMLGLRDPTNDSPCEYEHKSILVKKKRTKKEPLPKETRASEILKCREQNMPKMQDRQIMSTESKVTAENESNVFDLSEQNEINPKSFSIGSWINDLFNVPNKRQPSSQEVSTKPIQEERLIIDENSQYFKTISALKEEFRKKLRSETSIHVSNGDNPLKFDFCAQDKKTKRRSKSLPLEQSSESHVENVDDFILLEEEVRADALNTEKLVPVRQKYAGETLLEPYKLKSGLDLNCTSLVKEKKKAKRKDRSNIEGLDEYLTPSLSELSKGLLLNINDSEKCIQLYKNAHLNMQESQHYGQKKNKSYQSSARCYTTNTNLTEYFGDSSPKSSIKSYADYQNARVCQPFSNDSSLKKSYEDSSLRNSCHESRKNSFYKQPPRKLFSEFSRDSSTFVKVGSQKPPVTLPIEPGKYETKPTSDDLVKYLMKKVKSQRHMQPKKKSFVPATVKAGARNHRIMQSATSSLVMNVIAKKESENVMPFKTGSRISIENGVFKGETLTKPLFQAKDWSSKFKDNNVVKFDSKKATVQHRFNKNSYLSLDELEAKEIPCNKSLVKNAKRPYEDLIGNIVKERSEKLNKRMEVKKMLLKLDAKSTSLPNTSRKYKLKKNTVAKYPSLKLRNPESQELGRFHHQHELFKSAIQPCAALNLVTSEKFFEAEGVPYEVESSDKTVQLGFDLTSDIKANETKGESETDETSLMTMEADAENSALEPLGIDEKSDLLCLDTDKPQTLKDKMPKAKPSFIKDDPQGILNPVIECSSNENSKQKDGTNVCEPSACTPETRHGKALDGCLLNRRYSTNILSENKQKGKIHPNKTASFITELLKEQEGEMKDGMDKKKDDHAKKSANEEPVVKAQDQVMKNLLPLK